MRQLLTTKEKADPEKIVAFTLHVKKGRRNEKKGIMAMSGLHPAFIEKFMLMAMSNLMRKVENTHE